MDKAKKKQRSNIGNLSKMRAIWPVANGWSQNFRRRDRNLMHNSSLLNIRVSSSCLRDILIVGWLLRPYDSWIWIVIWTLWILRKTQSQLPAKVLVCKCTLLISTMFSASWNAFEVFPFHNFPLLRPAGIYQFSSCLLSISDKCSLHHCMLPQC